MRDMVDRSGTLGLEGEIPRPPRLSFRPVDRSDYRFLYELLVERYEDADVNIAGMARSELPSYEEHVAYLDARVSVRFDVILLDGERAGSLHLSPDRVASCFVLRSCAGRGVGVRACRELFSSCSLPALAYVNPRNTPSVRMARRLGMVLVEESPRRLAFECRVRPTDPIASSAHGRGGSTARS